MCRLIVLVVIFFSYKFLSFPNVPKGSSDGLSCELRIELCGPRNKVDIVLFRRWWHIFSSAVLWLDGSRFFPFGLSRSGPRKVGSTGHSACTALGLNSGGFIGWLNGVSSASAVSIGEVALSAVSSTGFDGGDLERLSSESVSGSVPLVDVEGSASG